MPDIAYYLAPQSPWTYLGHERFCELVARHRAAVVYRPVNLAIVFSQSGGLALSQRPKARQDYRLVELARHARALAKPLNLHPRFFPVSGDLAARVLIAAEQAGGTEVALALQAAIGRACWAEQQDIADGATLTLLAGALDLDGHALVQVAATAAIEATYQAYTEEALRRGVFGAPTYVIDDEPYWGQDRLDFVEAALRARSARA